MYEQLILRAAFIDRAGRVVYQAAPITVSTGEEGEQVMTPGVPVAMVRLDMDPDRGDSDAIEWLAPQPALGDEDG